MTFPYAIVGQCNESLLRLTSSSLALATLPSSSSSAASNASRSFLALNFSCFFCSSSSFLEFSLFEPCSHLDASSASSFSTSSLCLVRAWSLFLPNQLHFLAAGFRKPFPHFFLFIIFYICKCCS